jgi:plastocyanin
MMKSRIGFSYVLILWLGLWGLRAQAGTISGVVHFDGKPRPEQLLNMSSDPYCESCHAKPVPDEMFVHGKGENGKHPLANIFVYVKSGAPKGPHSVPTAPLVITREGCLFSPHVVGVRVGQPVLFQNNDTIVLNVHCVSRHSPAFTHALKAGQSSPAYTFLAPEVMAKVKSDDHRWERAFVAAVDHPFFQVTGTNGTFSISGLPDGAYVIETWQELLGARSTKVTVLDGKGTANVTYTTRR